MTYTGIATRFWGLHKESVFTHTEIALFLFILNEWHIRRKPGWMDIETRYLEIAVPISRKSLAFARENLRNRGLLDYEPGTGRGSARYTLCVSDSVSSVNTKGNTKETQNRVCVPNSVSQGNTNSNTKSFVLPEETQSKRKVSPTPPLKENNIYNINNNDNNARTHACIGISAMETYTPSETVEKLKSSWEWMESMQRTLRLTETELREALGRYPDHCTSLGETRKTMQEAKRHIYNWLLRQRQSTQTYRYETKREDRFSERRGTDPSANSAEDYSATF